MKSILNSAIRIGSFEGSYDDLHAFITGVWRREYEGRMAFPLWSTEYFQWHFEGLSSGRRDLLAAYDRDRLVATLLGLTLPIRVGDQNQQALLSSWLSVDADYRGQELVSKLKAEQIRRHRAAEVDLIVSYRYVGSAHSKAAKPTPPQAHDVHWSSRRMGFWTRMLDARRLTRWSLSPIDRMLARVGSVFLPSVSNRNAGIHVREYRTEDRSQCLEVLNEPQSKVGLAIDWSGDLLQRHVGGHGRCLVFGRSGDVRGLISYHILPFCARTVEPVAILDIVAIDQLSLGERRVFMNAALIRMREENAMMVLKLRTGDVPATAMLAAGFFPRPTDNFQMIHWLSDPNHRAMRMAQRFLWR